MVALSISKSQQEAKEGKVNALQELRQQLKRESFSKSEERPEKRKVRSIEGTLHGIAAPCALKDVLSVLTGSHVLRGFLRRSSQQWRPWCLKRRGASSGKLPSKTSM